MSTSAVEYNERLFWADDGLLSLWLYFMSVEAARESDSLPWLMELRKLWEFWAGVGGGGVTDTGLPTFVTEERKGIVLRLNAQVRERLLAYGKQIPLADLQSVGMECVKWTRPLDTRLVLEVVDAVGALL